MQSVRTEQSPERRLERRRPSAGSQASWLAAALQHIRDRACRGRAPHRVAASGARGGHGRCQAGWRVRPTQRGRGSSSCGLQWRIGQPGTRAACCLGGGQLSSCRAVHMLCVDRPGLQIWQVQNQGGPAAGSPAAQYGQGQCLKGEAGALGAGPAAGGSCGWQPCRSRKNALFRVPENGLKQAQHSIIAQLAGADCM